MKTDLLFQQTAVHSPVFKQKKFGIFLMSAMALAFSYIITKDIIVPSWIITVLILTGGIILFGLGINRPQIVTYVLVAYLPFSKVLPGDFGGAALALNLTNLLMIFILLVWMTGKYSENEPLWVASPLNVPILLFTIMASVSIVRGSYYGTGYLWISIIEFKRWITPILMYFLVLNTVKDRLTIRNLVIIMIVVSTIVGLMAIYDYLEVGEASLESSRIGGIAGHSNSLAAFFNYYMFLPFGFFLMNKSKYKYWLLLIPFLIQFRGIMVTFSRGGYIAFAFGLYAISFFRSKVLFGLLLIATALALFNPILLPTGIRYRMSQTIVKPTSYAQAVSQEKFPEESLDGSSRSRLEIWKGALKMIKEQPFFGIGYGLFFPLIRYYWVGGFSIDAHNTYLIIAAEMGIPALILFLWVIFTVIWHTYQLYRTTKDPYSKSVALGFLGGLFGLLMSNMFGSRLDSQEVSSYFWILAALIVRLKILDDREGLLLPVWSKKLDGPVRQLSAGNLLRPKKSIKLDACWNENNE